MAKSSPERRRDVGTGRRFEGVRSSHHVALGRSGSSVAGDAGGRTRASASAASRPRPRMERWAPAGGTHRRRRRPARRRRARRLPNTGLRQLRDIVGHQRNASLALDGFAQAPDGRCATRTAWARRGRFGLLQNSPPTSSIPRRARGQPQEYKGRSRQVDRPWARRSVGSGRRCGENVPTFPWTEAGRGVESGLAPPRNPVIGIVWTIWSSAALGASFPHPPLKPFPCKRQ